LRGQAVVRFYNSSRWVSDGSVGTTMFSQWATRQVVKFFLKRLLGRILRNNLDLEQLDVQLGWGTVQLKDLVLNTDYFNDQVPGFLVLPTWGFSEHILCWKHSIKEATFIKEFMFELKKPCITTIVFPGVIFLVLSALYTNVFLF
jgi:hypothetical protein